MEINITRFFKSANPNDYSGSIATHGPNAGPNTWGSAVSAFEKYPLINNNSKRIALRKHLAGFGAWEDSEINAWGNAQLNAMFLQLVSADMNESGLDIGAPDWVQYKRDSEAGRISGAMFVADDGDIYYSFE